MTTVCQLPPSHKFEALTLQYDTGSHDVRAGVGAVDRVGRAGNSTSSSLHDEAAKVGEDEDDAEAPGRDE